SARGRMTMRWVLALFIFLRLLPGATAETVTVGSKPYGESYLLAEMIAVLLEDRAYTVERRHGLGGSAITFAALNSGEIDLYPEYSGTITSVLLASPGLEGAQLDAALADQDLSFTTRFGFENNYALVVPRALKEERRLATISDLRAAGDLRLGFSYEFMNREDGWPALQAQYGLEQQPIALEHALAYRALDRGRLDVTDAYTTDGDLALYELGFLDDDLELFPSYEAGILARTDLPADTRKILDELRGLLDEPTMQRLNQRISSEGEEPAAVAAEFLEGRGLIAPVAKGSSRTGRIARNTLVHLRLTATALGLACIVAIPLALLVSRAPQAARTVQYLAKKFTEVLKEIAETADHGVVAADGLLGLRGIDEIHHRDGENAHDHEEGEDQRAPFYDPLSQAMQFRKLHIHPPYVCSI
ncbi:MAG: glycine betaine ABC transporter substrate-binding protein, partial [Pseudomonadota bacterium]